MGKVKGREVAYFKEKSFSKATGHEKRGNATE